MTMFVGSEIALIIDKALADGIETEEVMFEIFSCGALLGAANGNTSGGLKQAVGDLIDAVYTRVKKFEAAQEAVQ